MGLPEVLKVSTTLRDRLQADGSSFCCFYEKPFKLYIFGSLIIPENDFIFKMGRGMIFHTNMSSQTWFLSLQKQRKQNG